MNLDQRVRLATFEFLQQQSSLYGELIPWSVLLQGFQFEGHRVPLVAPQGIFKPALLEVPLTIRTTAPEEGRERPYPDTFVPERALLRYSYRGADATHPDNRGLRNAMSQRSPLVYLHGVVPGQYLAFWPVYVVGDDPATLTFVFDVSGIADLTDTDIIRDFGDEEPSLERRYRARLVWQRLHQVDFSARVLRAYRMMCSVCQLRHRELLDAAHILEDRHPEGQPMVSNGLALCKLHHAAFDRDFLGITPDRVVQIRPDILDEEDGPMLIHGLQGFQGIQIFTPRQAAHQPNPEFLAERYNRFLMAS